MRVCPPGHSPHLGHMRRLCLSLFLLLLPTWGQAKDLPELPTPRHEWAWPVQQDLAQPVPLSGAVGPSEARLWARAKLTATVQVLGVAHYAQGWEGGLAPVDLALGWGDMYSRDAIDAVTITQADRFYYWKVPGVEPWTARQVAIQSANMHIIPGNPSILAQIRGLRPGDRVRLHGVLVDALRPDGYLWRTSMVRDDTGAGACEIFLVLHLERAE